MISRHGRRLIELLAATAVVGAGSAAHAGVLAEAWRHSHTDYCSRENRRSATEQDRLLRFAHAARAAIDASGHDMVLVSRSGLDLKRFGQRYSHVGVALRGVGDLPWQVRQLYFDCQERRPRLFDQGLAGFVMGNDDPESGFLSLLFLPPVSTQSQLLMGVALDVPAAASLVATSYSANAYALSTLHQNCNQWLAELIGWAWSAEKPSSGSESSPRVHAQEALRRMGYTPEPIQVQPPWVLGFARWLPLLQLDDHPPEDLARATLQVSMPSSIERFVTARTPGTQRIELCHNALQIVVRRNGPPLPADCTAEAGDEVTPLD